MNYKSECEKQEGGEGLYPTPELPRGKKAFYRGNWFIPFFVHPPHPWMCGLSTTKVKHHGMHGAKVREVEICNRRNLAPLLW
jgi:hypothetical protein